MPPKAESFRYAPLGQWKVRPDPEEVKQKTTWRYGYKDHRHPSFESWCASTLYDPAQPNGGPRFQGLMHWVLSRDTGTPIAPTDTTAFKAGGKWHAPPVHKVTFALQQGKKESSAPHEGEVFCGKDTGLALPGGRTGFYSYSSGETGNGDFGYGNKKLHGDGSTRYKEQTAGTSITPAEKMHWWLTSGCGNGALKNSGAFVETVGDNAGRAWVKLNATKGDIKELSIEPGKDGGIAPLGLALAAYYGMYYYPDCTKKEWNWSVKQTVEGTTYEIRMRLPNPAYKREARGDDLLLRVADEAQPHYLKDPGIYKIRKAASGAGVDWVKEKEGDYRAWPQGEGLGFYAPVLVPKLPHEYLAIEGMRTSVTPWALGLPGKRLAAAIGSIPRASLPKWYGSMRSYAGERFSREDRGLIFGWSIPAANWLFPHGPSSQVRLGTGEEPGYVPWPKWADGYTNEYFATNGEGVRPMQMLTRPPPALPTLQQKYALGFKTPVMKYESYEKYLQLPAAKRVAVDDEEQTEEAAEVTEAPDEQQPEGEEDVPADAERAYEFFEGPKITEKQLQESEQEMNPDAQKRKVLPEGAARREPDSNVHFYSLAHSPWPPSDVYERPVHKYNRHVATAEEVKERQDYFGADANMYLQSTAPMEFDEFKVEKDGKVVGGPVEMQYGEPKAAMGMRLDSYRDRSLPIETRKTFARHMLRIVGIFLDESGPMGRTSARGCQVQPIQKRALMLQGVESVDKKCTLFAANKNSKRAPDRFGKVFDCPEADLKALRAFVCEKVEGKCTLRRGNQQQIIDEIEPDDERLQRVTSSMKVREWITTPWHVEYLPLVKMQSVFKDGEGFCAGCTRCSRPFTEYRWLYSPAPQSYEKAYWMFGFYSRKNGDPAHHAPLPFADPDHGRWGPDTKTARATVAARRQTDSEDYDTVRTAGYMGWETEVFKHPTKGDLPFRRYENRLKPVVNPIVQGVMRTMQAKVHVGMKDYRLQRMIKYGNVCTDCATVLNPLGLYVKAGVVGAAYSGESWKYTDTAEPFWKQLYGAPLVDEDGNELDDTFDPWFLFHMIEKGNKRDRANTYKAGPDKGAQRKRAGEAMGLDLSKIEDPRADLERYEKQLVAFVWYQKQLQGASMPTGRTKVTSVEVSTQPIWRAQQKKDETMQQYKRSLQQKIGDELKDGLGILQRIEDALAKGETTITIDASKGRQAALQKLYDVRQEEVRARVMENEAPTLYDPMMLREEYRNFDKEWNGSDWVPSQYPNSLRIVQLMEPSLLGQKEEPAGLSKYKNGEERSGPIHAYRQTIYYTKRAGTEANIFLHSDRPRRDVIEFKGTTPTWTTDEDRVHSWRGDAFLLDDKHSKLPGTKYDDAPRAEFQLRRRVQTRLFITYSLHRRIQTAKEADLVMFRMSKAVRYVFSTDTELSRLVVFGKKLRLVERGAPIDQMGPARWEHISKTKLDESTFYGDSSGNSYTSDTYETHVDSVELNAGVEIGPTHHMPHFHALVTFNHYSYLHVDREAIKSTFEQIFTNTGRFGSEEFTQFLLVDGNGQNVYDQNENPYVDIRLFPSDNWQQVVSAYVRKTAAPTMIDAIRKRNS